jgi:sugar lactone lactonase YvrE
VTVLASRYKGKRLNSPNDLTLAANGDLYFTDPCYGLALMENDPRRWALCLSVFFFSLSLFLSLSLPPSLLCSRNDLTLATNGICTSRIPAMASR